MTHMNLINQNTYIRHRSAIRVKILTNIVNIFIEWMDRVMAQKNHTVTQTAISIQIFIN